MKTTNSDKKQTNKSQNFDFILELSDDELDLIAGGDITFRFSDGDFSQFH